MTPPQDATPWLERAQAAWEPQRRPVTILLGICVLLTLLGVWWRIERLNYPPYMTFDEHHFVNNSRNILHRQQDVGDFPPLGKLFIAASMGTVGDDSRGWRVPSCIFGVTLIGLAFLLASAFFRDRRAGFMAAAFVAGDGLFVSYSRTALQDGPMSALMIASLLLMISARNLRWFFWAAVLLSLAISTKWIAGCLFLVVPLLLWRKKRSPLHAIWMLAVISVIYIVIYWAFLIITRQPAGLGVIIRANIDMLKHHVSFTDWQNAADSRWYTWPFLVKPITLHFGREDELVRVTSTVGNPFLWYSVTAGFVLAAVRIGMAWSRSRKTPERAIPETVRLGALLLLTAAVLMLQWYVTERESYIWHYFSSYYLGVVLLAGILTEQLDRRRGLVLAFVAIVALISIFYAPVWTNGRLTAAGLRLRLFAWP